MHTVIMGNVPLPEDLPPRLQQLIRGLITHDLAHRWGYKQVEAWLQGQEQDGWAE